MPSMQRRLRQLLQLAAQQPPCLHPQTHLCMPLQLPITVNGLRQLQNEECSTSDDALPCFHPTFNLTCFNNRCRFSNVFGVGEVCFANEVRALERLALLPFDLISVRLDCVCA